ncbi:DUF4037 domain-containing protein [Brachybacterium sp. YJGR34]|uniref:DUF4037 domain-containing protein n=1 Tax=Brachybacterium sp. YJGR34 TaxID=2059911 RepID=UPI000E09EC59|nr:DUF4037 domain-containing protein [Brachybacterium sp. YJGR34]
MAEQITGAELARSLYEEVIAPVVEVPHAACLIGEGSEVQGFDDARSRDHEWGPRLQLFVDADDVDRTARTVRSALPVRHRGYPTRWFSLEAGEVADHLEIMTLAQWMAARLPTIPMAPADAADWLAMPQQHLRQLLAGPVLHDDIGELTALRGALAWYPTDVWRWMLACQWHLMGQAHALLGRTLETGDRRGAALLSARLDELMMEMAFLQEKVHRPYAKWFGRAFDELEVAAELGALLDEGAGGREAALLLLARRHDALGLAEPVGGRIEHFAVGVNDAVRPYRVLNSGEHIEALLAAIEDPALRALPRVGSIDQLTHVDDTLITFTTWPAALAADYRRQL